MTNQSIREQYIKLGLLTPVNKAEPVSADAIRTSEEQIETEKKVIDYDTREFTIEYIVAKYLDGEEDDLNEIYVPEYQREFVWDDYRQSRFIESVVLGLPIPLIFLAEIPDTGRLEIVDGSQRIRTLSAYVNDCLTIKGCKTLTAMNDLKFSDLSPSRQRKINNTPMRMIVLSSKATEDIRNDMFDRINTSSLPLYPMEKRKGMLKGKFIDFVFECSELPIFKDICPIGKQMKDRQEKAELVLRYFAFTDTYPKYQVGSADLSKMGVERFLDNYLNDKNQNSIENELIIKRQAFLNMLEFVKKHFPFGFAKNRISHGTSRVYFEAISIGVYLALKQQPDLVPQRGVYESFFDLSKTEGKRHGEFWDILSERYNTHIPRRINERIDYVKNKLLSIHV